MKGVSRLPSHRENRYTLTVNGLLGIYLMLAKAFVLVRSVVPAKEKQLDASTEVPHNAEILSRRGFC